MRRLSVGRCWFWVLAVLALSGLPAVQASAQSYGSEGQAYPPSSEPSWGVGVVIGDGTRLETGGTLSWNLARNLTAVVKIPQIAHTDGTVYAILSVMTADGAVLQAAIGLYPGQSAWSVFCMYLDNVQESPQVYHWVTNSSLPQAFAGDSVSVSIFLSAAGDWTYRVTNWNSSVSAGGVFGVSARHTMMGGNQEVFALESYTDNTTIFSTMGNMTLESIYVDGNRSQGGWYSYGAWDPTHDLLFIIGGGTPPAFLGVEVSPGGTARWFYLGDPSQVWTTKGAVLLSEKGVFVLSVVFLAGLGTGLAMVLSRKAGKDRIPARSLDPE